MPHKEPSRSDASTFNDGEAAAWIEHAIQCLATMEPRQPSLEHVRVREAATRHLITQMPPCDIPRLIVALFNDYDQRKADTFAEMMWLIEGLYRALPDQVDKADACAILAATRHSCGHGGVEEPIQLVKRSFADGGCSRGLFDALRTYQSRLTKLRSAEVTRVRGEIANLLWLDPHESLRPQRCLSAGIRKGYFALHREEQVLWTRLFLHLDRTGRRRPDQKWTRGTQAVLNDIGFNRFTECIAQWLKLPNGTVPLSTAGGHVVKTIIWCCALCDSPEIDELVPGLIDLDYKVPTTAVRLIHAVDYWLVSRPNEFAERHRERLRQKWPIASERLTKRGTRAP